MTANCFIIIHNDEKIMHFDLNEEDTAKNKILLLRENICGHFYLYYGYKENSKSCLRTDYYLLDIVRKTDGTPF